MKFSREYILKRAFDVFMTKGYDSTSISVLQAEIGMSRGAMYRYFENKDDLFKAVIDEYFFKSFNKILSTIDKELTTLELIELVSKKQKILFRAFAKAGVTHTFFLNYTALMIQAAKHYPNFVYRYRIIYNKLLDSWRKALIRSIELGEVRKDVNIEIMSILFNNVSVKESSERNEEEIHFPIKIKRDLDKREEVMRYLYELIKV
ncbi:TetR/AcrR family transcriptional regulator [Dysgonomonas sp. Marseille-P4361]|uniref:TetR/AcrR family transcriptional regulator n=1 Tax=Dysgonomonas sp. Marseille-P4361 TaxID=2161820 RepID=UPI000D558473|nr:TetR/AcrR family transcriptional regulator [Dysgonomonas sp. Marseille-P4361]